MSFKLDIEKLIDKNLNTYNHDADRFIADYNRELELTKEYNGRQLLELLQNADDAGSDEVFINWDRDNLKLIISNKGEKFNVGGIKSLMLANLSTKTKISYIGNKGLGFRSILNWANTVSIYSNGCKISFSSIIAKNVFDEKIGLSENQKSLIKQERNLSKSSVPFPILAIPVVTEITEKTGWSTIIEIDYKKKFEDDIGTQLNELTEEILLFLNNIETIKINQTGLSEIFLKSDKSYQEDFCLVSIKDKSWRVFEKKDELPEEYQDKNKNEKQYFQLKVAFQKDLSDNFNKLFNFFPTQLSVSLPCIIHGTFELNSSRNHLNESKRNKFILENLVGLLKECAIYLSELSLDWKAYQILTPKMMQSDSKLIETFYLNLNSAKEASSVYPCIDGSYLTFEDVTYYNDNFNGFFKEHFPEILPELLIPLGSDIKNVFKDETFREDHLVEMMDELAKRTLSIELRAELIVQLSQLPIQEELSKCSILINEKHQLINKNDIAFTPVIRSGEKFNIPRSVKVDFMNSELFDVLVRKLEHTFEKKEPRSRELQRVIKNIVNLQPYDSNNVIDKVISGTNEALKLLSDDEEKIVCIREMVSALYYNFKNIENRQERLKVNVPLLCKSRKVILATELFLSASYASGLITEVIYSGLFSSDKYLDEISSWKLEQEESDTVESFFLWLGVNKFSRIETFSLQNNWAERDYVEFAFKNGTERPDNFEISKIQKESFVHKIENFNLIKALPLSRLILLVCCDSFIRKQLEGNDERISWYYVTQRPTLTFKFSYLRYQFISSRLFSKFILEDGNEQFNKLINDDFEIDYDFLLFYGINRTDVKAILLKMGAKESFSELAPADIYDILKAIPAKDKNEKGATTQKIYKLALDSLVEQESKYPIPDGLALFAKKENVEKYCPSNEVYYSDNTILPKKILNTLFLLNMPKRSGEDKVEQYFGVKSLREFKISLNTDSIKHNNCTSDVSRFFDSIKPYLLAYRLNSPNLKRKLTDAESKRREAKLIRQCNLHIIDQCSFDFGEKTDVQVEQKEFINVKDDFYYRDSQVNSLEELKRDSIFCDAFAEMICIVFKLNDLKNDFRQILKNELADTIHLAKQDLEEEKIIEAFELLGISRVEIDFWNSILALKGKPALKEPIENHLKLKSNLEDLLGLHISDDYKNVDFTTFETIESYELLKKIVIELDIKLSEFLPSGLASFHMTQFLNYLKDHEHHFKQLLWSKMNEHKEDQAGFIKMLNLYSVNLKSNIYNKVENLKFSFNITYDDILSSIVLKGTGIDLKLPSGEVTIENQYVKLLNRYNTQENDISEEKIRSLLYFTGNDVEIEEYLSTNHPLLNEGDNQEGNGHVGNQKGKLIEAKIEKGSKVFNGKSSNNGSESSWVHNNKSEKGKKKKGKAAEQLVYNTLIEEFGKENVRWVSGNSNTPHKNDKLHYDIEYKNHQGQWKHLEVKSISEDYFIITNAEKEMGLSVPDKYEMALVRDNDIFLVKDVFKFQDHETFDNNSRFSAYPKDFIFSFTFNN